MVKVLNEANKNKSLKKEYSDYIGIPYVVNYSNFIGDPKVVLKAMKYVIKKQEKLYIRKFNKNNILDQDFNSFVLYLLNSFNDIKYNYCDDDKKEDYMHTPLSYALQYGFYDIANSLVRKKDIDITTYNTNLAFFIWHYFDVAMLLNGTYKHLISKKELNVNEFDVSSICEKLTYLCNSIINGNEKITKEEREIIRESWQIIEIFFMRQNLGEIKSFIKKCQNEIKYNLEARVKRENSYKSR